jgi:O-antigen/teichoic acid export membrane protein
LASKDIVTTIKHALIYSASGIIGKAVGFVMLPVYAGYLRGEGYGIIGMIDVVISVLVILVGYGMQGAISRLYYEKDTQTERNKILSTAISLMLISLVIISLPVIIFNNQIAWLAFGKTHLGHYIIIAVLIFISDMSSKSAEMYILINEESLFYATLSFFRLVLALALNIFFIVYMKLGVLGYLYSGLITGVLFSIIIHWYALKNVGFYFAKNFVKDILEFTLPLLPGYIAMFIRTNVDRILLRAFLGLSQLGAFEILFKFATLIGVLVVTPFLKIWGVKRFEIADNKDGPETMAKVFTLMFSFLLFFGLVLGVEIPVIIKILTPHEFWIGGYVAGLAVLSRIILSCYYHFFFGLLYSKKTSVISQIQLFTTIFNVVFALLLIKPFGILGAVIVSCLTNTFQCLLALRMANHYYKIPFEWSRIITILVLAIFLFIPINALSVMKIGTLAGWFVQNLTYPLENLLLFFQLDAFKEGKFVFYILGNIPLFIDGIIKFVFSLLFVLILVCTDTTLRHKIVKTLKYRSFKQLLMDS